MGGIITILTRGMAERLTYGILARYHVILVERLGGLFFDGGRSCTGESFAGWLLFHTDVIIICSLDTLHTLWMHASWQFLLLRFLWHNLLELSKLRRSLSYYVALRLMLLSNWCNSWALPSGQYQSFVQHQWYCTPAQVIIYTDIYTTWCLHCRVQLAFCFAACLPATV